MKLDLCKVCGYAKESISHRNSSPVAGDNHEFVPIPEPKYPPIPMLLWCPECSARHIDAGEFATKEHHTRTPCQDCGMVWRPAIVPTVGVAFLPGFKGGEGES